MGLIDRIMNRVESDEPKSDRIIGKIIKLSDEGWGFISSNELKFTRIFFHWTALNQDTLHFTELRTGMHVEFKLIETEDKGFRALSINVMEIK